MSVHDDHVDHEIIDHDLYHTHETCNLVKKALDKFTARHDYGWHAPTMAPVYPHHATPTGVSMDPMQVLATLAFVAFLLQSLMALIDRITMTTRVVAARGMDDNKFEKAQEVVEAIRKFQAKKWDEKNK